MTEKQFRTIALGLEGAIEGAHMNHPDFRVNHRIFASLRGDGKHGMVVLTPDEQGRFVAEAPEAFMLESGAWGRQGCTRVRLADADAELVGEALTLAWRTARSKPAGRAGKAAGASRRRAAKRR